MAASSRRSATACWSSSAVPSRRCARPSSCSAAWSSATPALPADRRQAFRIGLHLGDVIVSDEDVFGDTVNVAARLQAWPSLDSIVLSASVYEQVRDKLALPFRDLGRAHAEEHRPADPGLFAGCSGPVAGRHQAVPDKDPRAPPGGRGCGHRGGAGDRRRPCLLRRSRGPGRCRGDHASRPGNGKRPVGRRPDVHQPERRCRPGLFLRRPHRGHHPGARPLQGSSRCSPTTPSCRSRNKELPPPEIGRALNARYLVSGSVRRMGQRVRVTVQLSDASNGTQLWAEQYDDELTDIFAVQERIARRVAGTLASSLQQIALQQSLRKPTDNLDAYDLLLRARALVSRSDARRQSHGARAAGARDADGAELRRRLCRACRHLFPARDLRLVGVRPAGRRDCHPAGAEGARDRPGMRACPQRAGARLHSRCRSTTWAWPNPSAHCRLNPSDCRGHAGACGRAAVDRPHRRIDRHRRGRHASQPQHRPGSLRSTSASPICWPAATPTRCSLLEAQRVRYPTYPLLDLPLAARLRRARPQRRCARMPSSRARRKNPHFDLASFGSRFQDPALQRRVEESLRKAGVN